MEYQAIDVEDGLHELEIKKGDTLLVHSSLKSFGSVSGGQKTVINAILNVIGEEGTLIVPTLTGKREDSRDDPPIFDVRITPCWTGIIPETVRNMEKTVRSYHPTHSVAAVGYYKKLITSQHESSYSPCDKNSPYFKLSKLNGYILLLGVDQESNTCIHSCEEIAEVGYHLQKEWTEVYIKDYDGNDIKIVNRLHNWNKPPTDFNKLDKLYSKNGIMKISKVCNSTVRLINAASLFDFTISLLRNNPEFLII
jgi:aminoglycoside 3-N-acetyltransferase